jgi:hypothetical protein
MKTFLVVSAALAVLVIATGGYLIERAFQRAKRHPE